MPVDIVKATIEYMRDSSGIYESDAKRASVIEPHFNKILDIIMNSVQNTDGTRADGAHTIRLEKINKTIVIFFREDKNDLGDGGCDPSTQVGLSMTRYWAQKEVDKRDSLLSFILMLFFSISAQLCAITAAVLPFSSPPLGHGSQSLAPSSPTSGSFSASRISSGLGWMLR